MFNASSNILIIYYTYLKILIFWSDDGQINYYTKKILHWIVFHILKVTSTGITLCDENAISDICKIVCKLHILVQIVESIYYSFAVLGIFPPFFFTGQTESAVCSFNGVCLCRKNWDSFFKIAVPFVRKEAPSDVNECSTRCSGYHHDYVPRIFDSKMLDKSSNKTYKFREKFCLWYLFMAFGFI